MDDDDAIEIAEAATAEENKPKKDAESGSIEII